MISDYGRQTSSKSNAYMTSTAMSYSSINSSGSRKITENVFTREIIIEKNGFITGTELKIMRENTSSHLFYNPLKYYATNVNTHTSPFTTSTIYSTLTVSDGFNLGAYSNISINSNMI